MRSLRICSSRSCRRGRSGAARARSRESARCGRAGGRKIACVLMRRTLRPLDPSHVLWIGGGLEPGSPRSRGRSSGPVSISGCTRSTITTVCATAAAAGRGGRRMPPQATPAELVESFVTMSRHRFRLVLRGSAPDPPSPVRSSRARSCCPTSVAAVLRDLTGTQLVVIASHRRGSTCREVRRADRAAFAGRARVLRLTTTRRRSGTDRRDWSQTRGRAVAARVPGEPVLSAAGDRSP